MLAYGLHCMCGGGDFFVCGGVIDRAFVVEGFFLCHCCTPHLCMCVGGWGVWGVCVGACVCVMVTVYIPGALVRPLAEIQLFADSKLAALQNCAIVSPRTHVDNKQRQALFLHILVFRKLLVQWERLAEALSDSKYASGTEVVWHFWTAHTASPRNGC